MRPSRPVSGGEEPGVGSRQIRNPTQQLFVLSDGRRQQVKSDDRRIVALSSDQQSITKIE
jgi:hypothetical protein